MSADVNIIFSNSRGVVLIKETGVEMAVKDGILSPDELAYVACINALTAKLRNGIFIDYDFKIEDFQNMTEVVKVEWLPRSGNLKFHGITNKKYHYCDTVEAALKEPRTFTCPRSIYTQLPQNRTPGWLAEFMEQGDSGATKTDL